MSSLFLMHWNWGIYWLIYSLMPKLGFIWLLKAVSSFLYFFQDTTTQITLIRQRCTCAKTCSTQSLYIAIWSHSKSTVCGCEQDLDGVLRSESEWSLRKYRVKLSGHRRCGFKWEARASLETLGWTEGEQVVLGSYPCDTETVAELWEDRDSESAFTSLSKLRNHNTIDCKICWIISGEFGAEMSALRE